MPQQPLHTQCNILINESISLTGSSIKQQESPFKVFFLRKKKHILQLFYIYFLICYPLKYCSILSNQDNFQKGFDVSTYKKVAGKEPASRFCPQAAHKHSGQLVQIVYNWKGEKEKCRLPSKFQLSSSKGLRVMML